MTERWLLGLDLGQAEDYSALCAVQQLHRGGAWHYHVRHLQRWELGTSYVRVADDVLALVGDQRLRGAVLVLDATGCGRPVVDMLRQRRPPCQLVAAVITGGARSSAEGGYWHVAKRELVAVLNVLHGQLRLRTAQELPLARVLESEYANFRAKVTASGHEVLETPWREGAHDDLLLALTLALWYGERLPPAAGEAPVVLSPGRIDPTESFGWGDPAGGPFMSGRNRTGAELGPPKVEKNWDTHGRWY